MGTILFILVAGVVILLALKQRIAGLKEESISLTTKLPVNTIGVILQQICDEWKTTAEQLVSNTGALSEFDDPSDIEILISNKSGLFSPSIYVVHVYVNDLGDERQVMLVAFGNSPLSKILYGSSVEMVSMPESIKRRDMIAEKIRG